MTGLPSIRHRLSMALLVVSFAWGVAAAAAVGLVVRHEVDELLDNTLQESAEVLLGLLSYNADKLPLHGGSMPAPVHDEHLVWQIVAPEGQVLLRSHQAPESPLQTRPAVGFSSHDAAWRVFGLPFVGQGRMLYVAQRGLERHEARLEAMRVAVLAALAVGTMGALWLRIRVRRELEPITRLSNAVKDFDPLLPDALLLPPTRSELVPMHHAVTDLGERLARRVATERAFVAHAAHALRTPLATMAANLALAQRRAGPDEQVPLQRTRAAADRLRRVVTALLTLFRSGDQARPEPVDLDDLAQQLTFDALEIQVEPHPPFHADPDLLAAALMNLLDNSLRHGARSVVLAAVVDGGVTRLQVRDDGSGIGEEQRQRLQSALDRQDYEALGGMGLLLADMVARAHGGRRQLLPGGPGCALSLSLQAADADRFRTAA